jgi:hypothetical protein
MIPDGVIRGAWRDNEDSLVDVVVLDTDAVAWDRAIAFASAWPGAAYEVDGKPSALPVKLDGLRSGDGYQLGHLWILVGGCMINCHFFGEEDEIEFDIDPRQVTSDEIARDVLTFVEGLARAVGRPVHLTPESLHERPMLSLDPATSAWSAREMTR